MTASKPTADSPSARPPLGSLRPSVLNPTDRPCQARHRTETPQLNICPLKHLVLIRTTLLPKSRSSDRTLYNEEPRCHKIRRLKSLNRNYDRILEEGTRLSVLHFCRSQPPISIPAAASCRSHAVNNPPPSTAAAASGWRRGGSDGLPVW